MIKILNVYAVPDGFTAPTPGKGVPHLPFLNHNLTLNLSASARPNENERPRRRDAHERTTKSRCDEIILLPSSHPSITKHNVNLLLRENIYRAFVTNILIGCLGLFRAAANDFTASSAAEITKLLPQLQPGDSVIMKDGDWKDQTIAFEAKGTDAKPITLRPQTPGAVLLSGNSSIVIDGEYVAVSGLNLKESSSTKDGFTLKGRHCRLTESAITGGKHKFFVHMLGLSNRLDHCYLANKTSDSPTLQIEVEGRPNHHRIDHNHFGPRPPLGRNGGETIRVGYSHQSMTISVTIVEENLFDRCDGEIEIISNKSCENVYRFNTFLDCAGMLTLRHGNRCLVEGNCFFAHHKRGSGGIRVIGEDHTIINNYIDGVDKGGFWITSGISNSPLVGYFQARNCLIAFNTVFDSRGPYLDLSAGFGSSGRTLRPKNITIANNVFLVGKGGTLMQGAEGADFKWMGNVGWPQDAAGAKQRDGLKFVDPKLREGENGLWRPAADSPVRGAAIGAFRSVATDIDGQIRKEPLDAGCDQISEEPARHTPITDEHIDGKQSAPTIGPAWLSRSLN